MRSLLFCLFLTFCCGEFSAQPIEVTNATVLAGLNRSLPYAKEHFEVHNPDLILPGKMFPYVRPDGKILLTEIKVGDCPWDIVKECAKEDALLLYSTYNYEATMIMNSQLARISWMVADMNVLAGIANDMGQFTQEVKHNKLNVVVSPPVHQVLVFLVILILCLFGAADFSMRFLKK